MTGGCSSFLVRDVFISPRHDSMAGLLFEERMPHRNLFVGLDQLRVGLSLEGPNDLVSSDFSSHALCLRCGAVLFLSH